jgi:hypothetical protein
MDKDRKDPSLFPIMQPMYPNLLAMKQFSDDEDEVDEPLVPIPDEEPEGAEEGADGDEEDERAASFVPDASVSLDVPKDTEDLLSKPPSPKPHPLSMSFQPASEPSMDAGDVLDDSLKLLDSTMDSVVVGRSENVTVEDVDALDMPVLGPDGVAFESVHNISQMEGEDDLVRSLLYSWLPI